MLTGSKKCDKVWNPANLLMPYHETDKACSAYIVIPETFLLKFCLYTFYAGILLRKRVILKL